MKLTRQFATAVVLASLAGHGKAQTEADAHGHPAAPPKPYAGQQDRAIKALSAQELASLLAGRGIGFAKAAELNGYPGPAHVLELAEPLGLEPDQLAKTRQLMEAHRSRAQHLGAELVEAERALDSLFAGKQAQAAAVDAATHRIGILQARVRAEHLNTHLTQTAWLSPQQIRRYSLLRGYDIAATSPHPETPGGTPK